MGTKVVKKVWGYRWSILVLVWLLYMINYLDRIAVLTFLPYIQKDLNLTTVQVGWLGSIFFFGYAIAQVSAGWLSDKIGTKKTMSIAIITFTFATFLTGFVKNFAQFICLRLGLALGEGHHFTPSIKSIAEWFPAHEKSRASGYFSTVFGFAPMLTPIIVTSIAVSFFGGAWRPVFFVLCIPGIIGVILLWKFMYNTPADALAAGKMEKSEYDMIASSIGEDKSITGITYNPKLVFTDSKFYLYVLASFMQIMIYWGVATWLTTFLVTAHGLNIKTMGIVAAWPYACAIVAQALGGITADKFFQGRPRIICVVSLTCLAPTLYFLGQVPQGSTVALLAMLGLAGFFVNFNWGVIQIYPSYRYPKEIVGRAMGVTNGITQFGAFISPLIASYLIITNASGMNDFSRVFIFWALLAAAAAIAFFFIDEKPISNADDYKMEYVPQKTEL